MFIINISVTHADLNGSIVHTVILGYGVDVTNTNKSRMRVENEQKENVKVLCNVIGGKNKTNPSIGL